MSCSQLLACSSTYSLTYSLTHSRSLSRWFARPLTHSHTHSLSRLPVCSNTYPPTHSPTHPNTCVHACLQNEKRQLETNLVVEQRIQNRGSDKDSTASQSDDERDEDDSGSIVSNEDGTEDVFFECNTDLGRVSAQPILSGGAGPPEVAQEYSHPQGTLLPEGMLQNALCCTQATLCAPCCTLCRAAPAPSFLCKTPSETSLSHKDYVFCVPFAAIVASFH